MGNKNPTIASEAPQDKAEDLGGPSFTRRDFLVLSGTLAGLGALSAHPVARAVRDTVLKGKEEADLAEALDKFEKHYPWIKFEFGPLTEEEKRGGVGGRELSTSEKADAVRMTWESITRYPAEFVRYSGVYQIRFLKDLSLEPFGEVGGFTNNFRHFYLDFPSYMDSEAGWDTRRIMRNAFDHELYHRGDFADSGLLDDNPYWAWINEKGNVAYYAEGAYVFDPKKSGLRHALSQLEQAKDEFVRPTGFAEGYGRAGIDEDQATIAELLMSDPRTAFYLAEKDQVFAEKLKIVKENYERWSDGKMGGKYWEDLSEGRVNEDYWGAFPGAVG